MSINKFYQKISLFSGLLLLFLMPALVFGQENNEAVDLTKQNQTNSSDAEEFDIVITGTKKARTYKNSPVSTRTVRKEQIESRGDTNLYQALRATTGVVPQTNCQNCNFDGLRLNGLDSKYNQILINSIPLVSPLAEVYFYNSFPETLIDRVEVVKGGGSALYGGGAVGGVINILLAKPKDNSASIGYQQNFINGEVPDGYTHFHLSRVSQDRSMGLSTFGSITYGKPFDYNNDGFSEISKKRGASLGFTGYISPLQNGELTYVLLYNRDQRDGGNAFDKEQFQAGIREGTDSDLYVGILKWDHKINDKISYALYSSASYMERRAYFGANEEYDTNSGNLDANDTSRWGADDTFLNGYSRTENPLSVNGIDISYSLAKKHDLLIGTSYTYEKLDDKQTGLGIQNVSTYEDTGAYLQYDGTFFKILQLVAGFRVDKHSEIEDAIISPRANLLVHVMKNMQWRLAYTTGFSPPRIYVEDFHLTVIDGDAQTITNADDLKAETSQSFSSSLSWQIKALGMNIELTPGFFYTKLEDAFSLEKTDLSSDLYERVNAGGAKVVGGEFDIKASTKSLEFSLGFSMQKSEFDESQEVLEDDGSGNAIIEKEMLRAPEFSGNASLIYDIHYFKFSTDLVIYGPMKTLHETPTDGSDARIVTTPYFYEWGVRAAFEFYHSGKSSWEVFAGVKNILDEYQDDLDRGYGRDAGYVYGPALPRTYYVGIKGTI